MYAAGGDHPLQQPCQALVTNIRNGILFGVTSAEVVQEFFHRFLGTARAEEAIRAAQNVLDLFAPVIPLTHGVMSRVPALARHYRHLGARDLVHVATCLEEGLPAIVTPDKGFDAVRELKRIQPTDEKALHAYGG